MVTVTRKVVEKKRTEEKIALSSVPYHKSASMTTNFSQRPRTVCVPDNKWLMAFCQPTVIWPTYHHGMRVNSSESGCQDTAAIWPPWHHIAGTQNWNAALPCRPFLKPQFQMPWTIWILASMPLWAQNTLSIAIIEPFVCELKHIWLEIACS